MTPFKIVYGCEPPPLIPNNSNEGDPSDLAQMLYSRDQILQQLKQNLHKSQARIKSLADKQEQKSLLMWVTGCW